MPQPLDIAIIGIAGAYAGAADTRAFWQNILDKVDAVAPADAEWTGEFLDPENYASRNDRTYTNRGGFLRDLAVINPLEYGVMPNQVDGGEPDHLLALKHAGDALADAGYRDRPFDRERAGVVLGRGTYVNRGQSSSVYHAMFMDHLLAVVGGLRPDLKPGDLDELRAALKKQLPPYSGELVGQLTPNVITGLIANRLDLMGPNYLVDAACASSLLAFDQAARELGSGRCDLMLAGGVHAHTPAQMYVQFSQINALSRGQLRPFEKGHSGTLLGEGVGIMVLKRLADAERDGDRIYAVARGAGVASDGRAKGLLTPRPEGEYLAMRRAYESSGIDPATIDLVEAHGTGTDVGDRTEIEMLARLFAARGRGPQIAVGSVKSMIGHCLPASGSASLIKTALALHHRVLPPTLCEEPAPDLKIDETPLYLNNQARPWIHGKSHPRRAGVNAFGFGGINAHVILEEYRGPRRVQVQVMHRPAPSELVLLAAESREALHSQVVALAQRLRGERAPTLAQVAKASALAVQGERRLALVADSIDDLLKKLDQAADKLGRADAKPYKTRSGVFYGAGAPAGKLCFVYPGEGAQYQQMLADLSLHFPQVRDWFDFLETTATAHGEESRAAILFPNNGHSESERGALEERLFEVDVAAESVFVAAMGLQSLFDSLGFAPDAMLGHSTGENTALVASGVRRFGTRARMAEAIRALNAIFRELDAAGRFVTGTLLTIGALRPEQRAELLAGVDGLQVAMDNCPNQLVMFGATDKAAALAQRLNAEGAICQALPFGRAYHTPLFAPMAQAYRDYLRDADFGAGRATLYSARSAAPFPSDPAAMKELAAQQWDHPVRFTDTVRRLHDDGYRVFVEIGPSGNLTSFIGDILRDAPDVLALAANSRRKSGVQQLQQTLAQLFVAGVPFDAGALYAHREIAGVDLLTAPAAPARREFRLKLQMPRVALTPALRERFAPPRAATVAEPATASVGALPSAVAPVPKPAPPAPADPRLAALQAHFSLMQGFLESQARVLGLADAAPDAQMAALPAVPPAAAPPVLPMLGTIVERGPDRIVFTRRVEGSRDIYLHDHVLGGQVSAHQPDLRGLMVIPFTFSMELVAEAALALVGAPMKVVGMTELRGHRWLALDDGSIELRTVAERVLAAGDGRGQRGVGVRVRTFLLTAKAPPGGVLVYEGHAELAAERPAPPPALEWTSTSAYPAVFCTPERLYGECLFHGPRLQVVQRIRRWSPQEIEADLVVPPNDRYFVDAPGAQLLTDAAALDAVGQVAAYWLFEQYGMRYYVFPFRIGRYVQYAEVPPAGTPLVCRGRVRVIGDARLEGEFDVLDASGRLLLRVEEWEDRKFEIPADYHRYHKYPGREFLARPQPTATVGAQLRRIAAFPEEFLDNGYGIWKRVLAHAVLGERERGLYRALPSSPPRREEWLLGRIAAKDAVRAWAHERGVTLAPADLEILPDAQGRPLVHCALRDARLGALPSVSIAHTERTAIAAIAEPGAGIGVDLQFHRRVRAANLVAVALLPDEAAAVAAAPESDRARVASAFWCAKEAAAKALGSGLQGRPQEFRIVAWEFDRRGGAPFADVIYGGRRLRVELQFEDDATVAVCRIPGETPVATRADAATVS